MKINNKYWMEICKHIPVELRADIIQEQWVLNYPAKNKKNLEEVEIMTIDKVKKKVKGEKISKYFFISEYVNAQGKREGLYSLSHISGYLLKGGLKNREACLRLWAIIKKDVENLKNPDDFGKMPNRKEIINKISFFL